MGKHLGPHLGTGTVLLATLVACSNGGGANKTGAAGAAGSTAGASGAAGGAGASAAGSGAAGVGTAGTGSAGAAPTDAGANGDAGPTPVDASGHETGPTSCAGRAISLSANGTGNDSDAARARVVIDLMADMPIGNASRTIEFWFYVKPTDWLAEKNEIFFYGALTGGTRQVIGLDFGTPRSWGCRATTRRSTRGPTASTTTIAASTSVSRRR